MRSSTVKSISHRVHPNSPGPFATSNVANPDLFGLWLHKKSWPCRTSKFRLYLLVWDTCRRYCIFIVTMACTDFYSPNRLTSLALVHQIAGTEWQFCIPYESWHHICVPTLTTMEEQGCEPSIPVLYFAVGAWNLYLGIRPSSKPSRVIISNLMKKISKGFDI